MPLRLLILLLLPAALAGLRRVLPAMPAAATSSSRA
jgi:hypothetical protein